jgi:hypothetical protein
MLPGAVLEASENRKSLKRLAAPQGFEPRYADPESAVLPLNEGAAALDCVLILWVDATLVNFARSRAARSALSR